jgi:thiol-disulfide isomerase/thioredoxin
MTSLMKRVALLAVGLSISAGSLVAQEGGIAVGAEAPGARVATLDGKPIDLGSYYDGKPVVLEFWATWCPLCKKLEPAMQAARARLGDKVHFVGIGVTANQSPERQREYVEKTHLTGEYVYDVAGAAVKAFSAPHTSYIVIIDASRRVVYTGVGSEQDIDAALKKAGL